MILRRAASGFLATVLDSITSSGVFGIVTLQEDNVNDQRLKVALSPQVKILKRGRAVPESKVEPPVTWLAASQR